jgi:hypothetical protein
MPLQKKFVIVFLAFAQLAVAGCTTIAFFPAAPAQKAADKLIDDIWPAAPARPATASVPSVPSAPSTTQAKDGTKDVAKADADKTEVRK